MAENSKIPALQKSTMEVRIPQYCLYRAMSIITAVQMRRLTAGQRKAMKRLWRLSFKEYKFGGHCKAVSAGAAADEESRAQ
jgi:hypothetical protein